MEKLSNNDVLAYIDESSQKDLYDSIKGNLFIFKNFFIISLF